MKLWKVRKWVESRFLSQVINKLHPVLPGFLELHKSCTAFALICARPCTIFHWYLHSSTGGPQIWSHNSTFSRFTMDFNSYLQLLIVWEEIKKNSFFLGMDWCVVNARANLLILILCTWDPFPDSSANRLFPIQDLGMYKFSVIIPEAPNIPKN